MPCPGMIAATEAAADITTRLLLQLMLGDIKIKDTDGDGKLSAKDRVIKGSQQPKGTYGLTLSGGYKKVNWGKTLVDNDDEYYKYLFYDYDYVSAPIYLWPFTPNIIATGGFVNGYGFSNK